MSSKRIQSASAILAVVYVTQVTGLDVHASCSTKLTASDAAIGDQLGFSVSIDGDTAIIGAHLVDGPGGVDEGAAYVFRWDGIGWNEEAKLTPADGASGDEFGFSVAIHGDTAIVGARYHDGPAPDSGAAYVFTRSGVNWTEVAKLIASDAEAGDSFGSTVSLDGDAVAIGARDDDGVGGVDQGSVYIFRGAGSTWMEEVKLAAGDGLAGDSFGRWVDLDGDTVIVSAYNDDEGAAVNQGSAYIFTRSGATWAQQAKLLALDGEAGDRFGFAVSVDGDVAAISAFLDDDVSGLNQGSVYVYTRSGSTWTEQAKLLASDGAPEDRFGFSISLHGDVLLVGARADDEVAGADQGSAYVFTRVGAAWTQQQKLIAPDGAASDQFGFAVSLDGDTALIGARLDTEAALEQGSAYVVDRVGESWVSSGQQTLAADSVEQDHFGASVAIDGETAVIGTPLDDDGGLNSGSAYILKRAGVTWAQQAKIVAPYTTHQLGGSVAISGNTAILSAHEDTGGGILEGSVLVYVRSGSNWSLEDVLFASDGSSVAEFGYAVALDGDTAIVGARSADGAGFATGAAYVFTRIGSSWTEQQKLIAADGITGDLFGASVAISGDSAIIGANGDDDGGTDSGSAYVFTRSGSVWSEQQELLNPGGPVDQFGNAVAISGDTAIVGAFLDSPNSAYQSGSAYVFTRSGAIWTLEQAIFGVPYSAGDQFGASVAIEGDTVIVGADAGDLAYIFTRTGNVWTQQAWRRPPGVVPNDDFGSSVALSGDTAVVGAPLDTYSGAIERGSAHFYLGTFGCSLTSSARNLTSGEAAGINTVLSNARDLDALSATYGAFMRPHQIVDFQGRNLFLASSAEIHQPSGSVWTIDGGGTLAAPDGRFIDMFGETDLSFGSLVAPRIRNARMLTSSFGTLHGDFINDVSGSFIVNSSTQIGGDFINDGFVSIDGALTISGALTNRGTIEDVSSMRNVGGGGVSTDSDLSIASTATLRLDSLGASVVVGGDFDCAINDNGRLDLATAELRMDGVGAQSLERMSIDIGADPAGLDRTIEGHYPIGTLRLAGNVTDLIDARDNDNLGQATCEAIYVRSLIIEAGATLNTNGCPLYYETLVNDGSVDDPNNLMQILVCTADVTGDGIVDGADLAALLSQWGGAGSADFDADGNVDGADLALLLAAWGGCA